MKGNFPAVFLDRDGVILEEKNYLSREEDVVLLKEAADGIRLLSSVGLKIVIVTNQSGIGRGLFSEGDYRKVMERMLALLGKEGARIDGAYFCPHAPWEGCGCRKPSPGLVFLAEKELDLNLAGSFVVGDKQSDIELARAIGARSILVRTGYGSQTERAEKPVCDAVAQNLREAAEIIVRWVEGRGEVEQG